MQKAPVPVFSVIIPHYGIPELLRRCLASIPDRADLEVIVVDDCSPDGETYPERYPDLFREGVTWLRTPVLCPDGADRVIDLRLCVQTR